MEFCLNLSHHSWTRETDQGSVVSRTLETVHLADRVGLDSVWLSEDPDGWDAFAVLAAAARSTERVRLGTGVTNPYLRHPNLLAMSVATLDRLSEGRAFLGLGRGQPEWYGRRLGYDTGSPLQVLSETVDLLQQWWQPPYRASVDGYFQVKDWPHAFGPARNPPIYLAALGPKAIDLAAAKFDGLMMSEFASESFLRGLVDDLRARLAASGRSFETFPIFVRTAIEVTDDAGPALERRKNLIALINALPGMSRHMVVDGFDVPAIMRRVREAMRTDEVLAQGGAFIDMRRVGNFEAARDAIPTELVDAVSYVGSAEKIRGKLERLASIGISHVFVSPPPDLDTQSFTEMLSSIRPRACP